MIAAAAGPPGRIGNIDAHLLTVAGLWMLISPAVLYLVRSARNLEAVRDATAPLAEPA